MSSVMYIGTPHTRRKLLRASHAVIVAIFRSPHDLSAHRPHNSGEDSILD